MFNADKYLHVIKPKAKWCEWCEYYHPLGCCMEGGDFEPCLIKLTRRQELKFIKEGDGTLKLRYCKLFKFSKKRFGMWQHNKQQVLKISKFDINNLF